MIAADMTYRHLVETVGLGHDDAVEVLKFRRFLQIVDAAPMVDGTRRVARRWVDYAYPPGHPQRDAALRGEVSP